MKEEIDLWSDGYRRITGVTGSIFDEDSVDAIVLYKPEGLVSFPFERDAFFKGVGEHQIDGDVHQIAGKRGLVRFAINGWSHARDLSFCHRLGIHSVAMNGIRTSGYGECDNIAEILFWWKMHPGSKLSTVRLVDLRGGFVRLGKLREEGCRIDSRGYSTDFETASRKLYIEEMNREMST